MRRFGKWCGVAALMAAVLVLAADDSRGQQVQFQRPGGGGPGGGMGMDPDAMFNAMAKGQNQINLNDPANAWMKGMRERRGQPIPPNGIITREMFKTEFQQQMTQGGGFGGRGGFGGGKGNRDGFGGGKGGFGGQPGFTPPVPGAPAAPGGPGGFPGAGGDPNQFFDSMFQRADRNSDGRITMDEANDRLKPMFAQYDKNGDGALDKAEFQAYMTDRFAQGGGPGGGRGGPGGGPNGFGGPTGGPQFGQGFQPPQGNWQGGQPPAPGGDPNGEGKKGKRRGEGGDDEEDARPVVYRYGKLPKEIPSWFEKYDTDKDGMVGLYEWRRAGEKTDRFVEMDLNGDGYLTADEWLRYTKAQLEKKSDDDEEGGERPTISRFGPGEGGKGDGTKGKGGDGKSGWSGFGKGGGKGGEKGGKGGEKGGGKRNPFTGG